jgi:hypothetical protein
MEAKKVDTKIMGGFVDSVRIGEPTTFQNLTVLPIFSEQGGSNGFSLLDDAIRTDKFRVTEVSDSGTVPELKVINQLDINVLIIDGEELIGAKQNRIVNTTILVGKETEVVIPVSCVEHGRWHYRTKQFSTGRSHLYADLRRKKSKAVHSNLQACASFHSNQSEIWEDISVKAARFNIQSETDAMNDIYESHEDRITDYEKQFTVAHEQIGFVAFIGGKIVGLDIFGSTSVIPKVYKKLLSGYILDALDHDRTSDRHRAESEGIVESSAKVLQDQAKAFLGSIKRSKKEVYKSVGEGDEFRFGNKQVNGFALVNNEEVIHVAAFAE